MSNSTLTKVFWSFAKMQSGGTPNVSVLQKGILVGSLVQRAVQGRGPNELILRTSPRKFREEFQQLAALLGLATYQFRPYSLRRGGATFDLRQSGNMELVLVKGRWQSNRTARIYLNDGLATLTTKAMSEQQRHHLHTLTSSLHRRVSA